MHSRSPWIELSFAAFLFVACGDDVGPVPPPTRPYGDLTRKTDVLQNMETAYNRREIRHYDALLDSAFTFVVLPPDVRGASPGSGDAQTSS